MDAPAKLLPVTMNTSTAVRRSASASRLLLGGAAVLMLAGMVVAPLWAAFSLCAMPCCQHSVAPEATSGLPCNSECAISDLAGQNVAIVALAVAPTAMAAPVALACTLPAGLSATAATRKIVHPSTGPPTRARHLVNSVFLI